MFLEIVHWKEKEYAVMECGPLDLPLLLEFLGDPRNMTSFVHFDLQIRVSGLIFEKVALTRQNQNFYMYSNFVM